MAIAKLNELGQEIFEKRYAFPGETTWSERAKVIAKSVAMAEKDEDRKNIEDKFYKVVASGDFIPGGRIIFGAGRNAGKHNMLNCYVIEPTDSVDSIGKTVQDMYRISCAGGGIGFNFSKIRPKGDDIQNIKNSAPGAVSVMRMINEIGEHVRAGKNRRCLRKGTRVQTNLGIKNIEDVEIGDLVVTKEGYKPVLDHLYQGKQGLVRIKTQDGYLDCTPDHRVAKMVNTAGEYVWIQAQELNPGDRLLFIREASDGKETSMPSWSYDKPKGSTTCQDITIPDLDEDMAWFLGLFAGDGCASVVKNMGSVFVACETNQIDIIAKAKKQLERFGVNVSVYKKKGENCTLVKAYSKQLSIYFNKHIKQSHTTIRVPDFINQGTKDIREAYVCGVFDSDGCAKNKPLNVVTSVYEDFALDIKALINSCGYECRFLDRGNPPSRKNWRPLYQINLITAHSKQILDKAVKSVPKKTKPMYSNGFPSEWLDSEPAGWCKNNKQIAVDTYERLVTKTKIVPVEVKEVEDLCIEEDTYDISVEGEHCFLAEGLLVHNTALMGILNVTHPDLFEFLDVKLKKNELNNFNISVAITDRFIEACEDDEDWHFTFNNKDYYLYEVGRYSQSTYDDKPEYVEMIKVIALDEEDAVMRASNHYKVNFTDVFKNARLKPIKAKKIWETIFTNSVESGDPGIFNISLANKFTNVSYFEELNSTNPCGEISLPSYGNCCLGNLNLSNFVLDDGSDLDWKRLAKSVRLGIRFLDNVLTVNHFPTPECKEVAEKSRRIGLGVTGLHYMLIKLGLKYGSEKSLEFIERLFSTIRDEAYKTSIYLARDKSPFPEFDRKKFLDEGFAKTLSPRIRSMIKDHGIRNAVMLTIPPCGTISMLHGVSSGIEPIFSAMYKRRFRDANVWKETVVVDPLFQKWFDENKDLTNFVGAYDVTPEDHIKVQSSIQQYIDSCISKTINIPSNVKAEDLSDITLSYVNDLKGLTLYRASSKDNEPLEAIPLSEENIKKYMDSSAESGIAEGSACSLSGGNCGE